MIDVQYTRALHSLSNRLNKIREQTYITASNVAVFSSFLFADFILQRPFLFLLSIISCACIGFYRGVLLKFPSCMDQYVLMYVNRLITPRNMESDLYYTAHGQNRPLIQYSVYTIKQSPPLILSH
jgi:hypothetical protein